MSETTLDSFMFPNSVQPKQDTGLHTCSDCGALLGGKTPEYALKSKGVTKSYCRKCATKRLPKPKVEENADDKLPTKGTSRKWKSGG